MNEGLQSERTVYGPMSAVTEAAMGSSEDGLAKRKLGEETGMGWIVSLLVVVPMVGFWIWMYREMTHNFYLTDSARYYWTLAFAFMNIFGAVAYFVLEYRNRT